MTVTATMTITGEGTTAERLAAIEVGEGSGVTPRRHGGGPKIPAAEAAVAVAAGPVSQGTGGEEAGEKIGERMITTKTEKEARVRHPEAIGGPEVAQLAAEKAGVLVIAVVAVEADATSQSNSVVSVAGTTRKREGAVGPVSEGSAMITRTEVSRMTGTKDTGPVMLAWIAATQRTTSAVAAGRRLPVALTAAGTVRDAEGAGIRAARKGDQVRERRVEVAAAIAGVTPEIQRVGIAETIVAKEVRATAGRRLGRGDTPRTIRRLQRVSGKGTPVVEEVFLVSGVRRPGRGGSRAGSTRVHSKWQPPRRPLPLRQAPRVAWPRRTSARS